MKIPQCRVTYQATVSSTAVTLSGILSAKVNYGIEAIKDTFEIKFIDKNNSANIVLDGLIKIYLNDLGSSETLIMDGIISEVRNKADEKDNSVVIKGSNRLEVLLNHQVRADKTDKVASTIIQELIQAANQGQKTNRIITWASGNDTTTKVVDYYSEYRPIFEHIEKLSSDEYTGDGQYIYYLDTITGEFVWQRRPSIVTGTINYGDGTIEFSRTKNPDDVINFLLINAGKDLNDNSITTYAVNPTSIGNVGWRTKFVARPEYADFIRFSLPGLTDNSQFRNTVKNLAQTNASSLLNEFSGGTDKLSILVPGSNLYTAGQLYQIILPHTGWNTVNVKTLRLMEFEHNYNKNGWFTTLSFKEELVK